MRRNHFDNSEYSHLLNSPGWSRCEALIQAFEEAWRRGETPVLREYLRAEGQERQALLLELIHIDLEFHLKAGEPSGVEEYLEEYPELAKDRQIVVGLLAAEFELCRRYQGEVGLEEYRLRFPDLVEDLILRLVAPHSPATPPHVGATQEPRLSAPVVPGYEIEEEIGRGGMGVVYKARETSLGRHVALKFLPSEFVNNPERLGRFLREARTASALNHPHICTVHVLGENEGRPYIVMEFIEGQTLSALSTSRPSIDVLARLLSQAAGALAAAHEAGVVHRDIKPENIMVRADGYVKVLDFGLARQLPTLARPKPDSDDTDPGAIMGTVAYMSPEQARGTSAESPSDIFALGIVLYQFASGRHPFEGDGERGVLYAIATSHPVPLSVVNPEIPAVLSELVETMLHKDARMRPTAAEVEAILTALAAEAAFGRIPSSTSSRPVVRREPELAILRSALADAEAGRGGMVVVGGEPGIGKTTLIAEFLDELNSGGGSCRVARGCCSERLAGSNAYLPIIDALESLLRGESGFSVARLMKVVAPTWYSRVVPSGTEGGAPAEVALAASQQALLRELRTLIREVSRLNTLVLFLDDVHWADSSTVDLLAYLGPMYRELRLLVLVAYRPTELLLEPHPFLSVKRELQGKGICIELPLRFLRRADIDRYLTLAFPGHAFPKDFSELIHSRTEGNPLFMANLLSYLRERGALAMQDGRWTLERNLPDLWKELPESARSMIQRQLERLDEADRRLLAAASVQGTEFDSAVVAGALGWEAAEVEERLQPLDRVHALVRRVCEYEFPDRTLTLRYGFVHVQYQQALYSDLSPNRRAALSSALARTLERHHGEGNVAVAGELACLYEVGRDFGQAAHQFHRAAQNAAKVFAHREAADLARRGLRLLEGLPKSPESAALELPLQMVLGLQLQVTFGYAAPEAKSAYLRARHLCARSDDPASLFPVLWGLWLYSKVRSELVAAQEMADELDALSRQLNDSNLLLQAHQALGITAFCRGDPAAAVRHVEQASALYDSSQHRVHANLFGQDPSVIVKGFGAVALWLLGIPAQAEKQIEAAIRESLELSPTSQAVALHFAAMVHQLLRNPLQCRRCADELRALGDENGLSFWRASGTVMGGWAQVASGDTAEGTVRLRQGLRDWLATGSLTYHTYYLGLLAEVLWEQRQAEESMRILEEALSLVQQTGEGFYEAELLRLRGELRLCSQLDSSSSKQLLAEEDFRRALGTARRQGARSLELRAAMSLARCLRTAEASSLLAEVLGQFTEGLETPDLREARGLLDGRVETRISNH
jgi:adenylate cyclase